MKRRELIKGLSIMPLTWMADNMDNKFSDDPFVHQSFLNKGIHKKLSLKVSGKLDYSPQIYNSIGVEPVINCLGTLTIIGGSIELPEVRKAMELAAPYFVQLDELANAIGKRFSEITGAEWGMVSSGCAAAIKLLTIACVTDGDPEKLIRIPNLTGFEKTEVIIPSYSRIFYDHSIRNVGVKIITVSTREEFIDSLNKKTAMIFLFTGSREYYDGPLSIENVLKITKDKKVPIVVDAAAEILTIPNIHLQKGATVVCYSGGKALQAPQSTGLILGQKDLISAAWQASSPHHGPGRDNKVDSEEQIGMLAAVEAWVMTDHVEKEQIWISRLKYISKHLSGINSVKTQIREPQGIDNRSASLIISWNPSVLNITGEEVAEDFAKNRPRIALRGRSDLDSGITSISVNAYMMQEGEEKVVAKRIHSILSKKRKPLNDEMKKPIDNIIGRWEVDILFLNGSGKHEFIIERQNGNWIHGIHLSGFSRQEINGTIEGDLVKLQSSYSSPGDTIPFIFSGILEDETITGKLFLGEYGTANFSAAKSVNKENKIKISEPNFGRRNPNAW